MAASKTQKTPSAGGAIGTPRRAGAAPGGSTRANSAWGLAHNFDFGSGDDDLSQEILEAIVRMGAVGGLAEAGCRATIEGLQSRSENAALLLDHVLRRLPDDRYLDRWSVIHLMGEIGDPASLRALRETVEAPIIEREIGSDSLRTGSSRREEMILKTTAIESIQKIAHTGDEEAVRLLMKYTRDASFSVRRAAVQGFAADRATGDGATTRDGRNTPLRSSRNNSAIA